MLNARVKPLEAILAGARKNSLHRSFGLIQLTLLGVGGIIGSGIFVLISEATQKAGPGMILSFVVAGAVCAVAALCYSELAAMVPVAGSAYTYTYAVMGELIAWLVGWALVLEYAVSASAVAVGWSGYFAGQLHGWFGLDLPAALMNGPFEGGVVNVPATVISLAITGLLILGTTESARVNSLLVGLKLVALVVFCIFALPALRQENFYPLLPLGWASGDGAGVIGAAASIFFAYVGFDAVSIAAEETRNPHRTLPLALIGSLAICTVFYLLVALGAIGAPLGSQPVMSATGEWLAPGSAELAARCSAIVAGGNALPLACSDEALAHVLRTLGYLKIGNLIGLAAFLALPSVILVMIYGQTRMFFVMARDGLLPERLAAVHPKWKTPHVITAVTGIGVTIGAAFLPVGKLADISNAGTLFAFAAVAISVMTLRRTDPHRARPFRTPAVWIVAPLTIIGCLVLYIRLPYEARMVLPIWGGIGLLLYFCYGYRNSHVGRGIASAAVCAAIAVVSVGEAEAAPVGSRIPPSECAAHAGFDRDLTLPGYLLPTQLGPTTCIPFTVTAERPPAAYKGDFYVDEFTEQKLRDRWAKCKVDPACFEKVNKIVVGRRPPNKEHGPRSVRDTYLLGKIDADNPDVDLKTIRRPVFFARAPYRETIAQDEGHTFTVEFTAPAEVYERVQLNLMDDIKLRGWYQVGQGIDDGKGHKIRALIIMTHGGGGRIVAIEDPGNKLYYYDSATGQTVNRVYPDEVTGASGERGWRQMAHAFNAAGYDVLNYDRRGVGVSGGFIDTNTVQQGRDLLKVVGDLKSGVGVRVLTPSGVERKGLDAANLLTGGNGEIPVILYGESRGTMSTGFAMASNFDKACDYDHPVVSCGPPVGLKNIKGAMNVADYTPGMGYLTSPTDERDSLRPLYTAGTREAYDIVFFPSSAILASLKKWPALFIGRGLWDYASSLEGSVDAMERVKGLKELLVVRAGHPLETWPDEEKERLTVRMVAFARAAVLDQTSVPGGRQWSNMKELAATASDVWETSSHPDYMH